MHEMFTNHPILRKEVRCSSFSTLIGEKTEGFFGLLALNRIINQELSYVHISNYFCFYILCVLLLLSHRQLQSFDLQHLFPSKFFCCQSLAN
jgi:hypothetical protein